jgi:hypothetical protein
MEITSIGPNYFAKKILYPSTVKLRQELGMQDSHIHLQELGTRVLLEEINKSGGTPEKYLSTKFREHGLSHGTHDVESLSVFSAQSYIAQTYAILEKYLKNLSREYRNHKWIAQTAWDKGDSEKQSPYIKLLENLPPGEKIMLASKPESKLFEYYRAVRVATLHRNEDTLKKAEAEFMKFTDADLDHFKNKYILEKSGYQLNAPNRYGELTYDDYYLFTRAIKYFSNLINDACDLQCEDIVDFLRHGDNDVLELLSAGGRQPQPDATAQASLPKDNNPIKRISGYAHAVYGVGWNTRSPVDHHDLCFVKQRKEISEAVRRLNQRAVNGTYFRMDTSRAGDFMIRRFEKSKEKKLDTEKENFSGSFEEISKWIRDNEK